MGSVLGGRCSRQVMSAFVCSLDVYKDSTHATILAPDGKIVNQTRMSNDRVLSYLPTSTLCIPEKTIFQIMNHTLILFLQQKSGLFRVGKKIYILYMLI